MSTETIQDPQEQIKEKFLPVGDLVLEDGDEYTIHMTPVSPVFPPPVSGSPIPF